MGTRTRHVRATFRIGSDHAFHGLPRLPDGLRVPHGQPARCWFGYCAAAGAPGDDLPGAPVLPGAQYVAPQMEYQTVMESKEITIQVPKVIMEEVEITYQVPAMETKTRTVQRPKTIMEDKEVTVQEPRTVMETRSVQVPFYMNQAMPGATMGSMVAAAPAADGLAYQPTQDDAISA